MKTSVKIKDLEKEYLSEFCIIDGLNQHPTGYNFNAWLKYIKGENKMTKKPEKTFMIAVRINQKFCTVFTFTKQKDVNEFLKALDNYKGNIDIEYAVPID